MGRPLPAGRALTAARATNDAVRLVLTVVSGGADPQENMGELIEGDRKYRVFEHTRRKKAGT